MSGMSWDDANTLFLREQLRRVLDHGLFRDSERHRRLLEFLVESTLAGRAADLKEFVVAAEVWGRDISFDPRIHSTVRVEVGRLRTRLDRYYLGDGAGDPVRFRIPVGGYAVVFETTGEAASAPSAETSHFEVLETLGRGGMGEIRKARDTRLNRFVALKFVPESLTQSQAALDRFRAEARAAAAINHPNICTIYDTGFLHGRPFLAMELLDGQTLRHRLQNGPIALETFLNWAIQIADGLDAAHACGIVHRDLKPANLFITTRDQAKILDFGLAKLRESAPPPMANAAVSDPDASAAGLTTVAGTLGYMSPEQTRGETVDSRSDLFSLGAVFYEMLTGAPAFSEPSAAEIHRAVLTRDLPPPSQRNPALPADVDRILLKALERDRELRYQNAADLRADLKRLKRDSDSGSHSARHPPPVPIPAPIARPKRRWIPIVASFVILAIAAVAFWWYGARPVKLPGNGNVVISDFVNTTGDPVFDATLRQGLAGQLEQSPYIALVSDARVSQVMKLMNQSADSRLTPELARQVCQRTGSAVSIEGSIASLGTQFVLGLRALNCKTGDVLAQDQETASRKEQVLQSLGNAAAKLRRKLGESLPSLERYDTPTEGVTTGSLEALQAYSLGIESQSRGDCPAAVPHFQRAIALDPNFAMAYGHLGVCLGSSDDGNAATLKAYSLRDHVSDREKFYLESHYEQYLNGDIEAARAIFETWSQTYPHDRDLAPNLLRLYLTAGQYDKALAYAQEIVRTSPETPLSNSSRMGTTLLFSNRIAEAKAVLQDAVGHHNDGPVHHFYLYEIAFLEHDSAAMARETAYIHAQPAWQNNMTALESMSAGYMGQFGHARDLTSRVVNATREAHEPADAAAILGEESLQEALAGDKAIAIADAKAALAASNDKDVATLAAQAFAWAGDPADANRTIADLLKRFPKDTLVRVTAETVRAVLLTGNGDSPDSARRALNELADTAPYELSSLLYLAPVYARAQAYLAAGQSASARTEFQKILNNPGVTRNFVIGAIAHYGLAQAEEQLGDKSAARAEYAAFLALWHDADPGLPLLKSARSGLDRVSH